MGDTSITLADESMYDVGDSILVTDGTNSQLNTVVAKGTLTLQDPLQFSFSAANTQVAVTAHATTTETTTTGANVASVAQASALGDEAEASSSLVIVIVVIILLVIVLAASLGAVFAYMKGRQGRRMQDESAVAMTISDAENPADNGTENKDTVLDTDRDVLEI